MQSRLVESLHRARGEFAVSEVEVEGLLSAHGGLDARLGEWLIVALRVLEDGDQRVGDLIVGQIRLAGFVVVIHALHVCIEHRVVVFFF